MTAFAQTPATQKGGSLDPPVKLSDWSITCTFFHSLPAFLELQLSPATPPSPPPSATYYTYLIIQHLKPPLPSPYPYPLSPNRTLHTPSPQCQTRSANSKSPKHPQSPTPSHHLHYNSPSRKHPSPPPKVQRRSNARTTLRQPRFYSGEEGGLWSRRRL